MRILVVTGSSGGHIFPALGFLESLESADKNIEARLLLPRNCKVRVELPQGVEAGYSSVTSIKPELSLAGIKSVFNFIKGAAETLIIVAAFKPDIVVGFGSLNSVPAVLWAWLLRIRTIIHEQNVLPGQANKLLSVFADKIAISFAESRNYLKGPCARIVLTGNPLRKSLTVTGRERALEFFGLDPGKFTVLISGGSQGSSSINSACLEAMRNIAGDPKLQAIHLCGEKDYARLQDEYRRAGVKARLFSFLKEMPYAYCASDLAIMRSGAMTIAELIRYKLPAVLVPYPYARKHQSANAAVLGSKGCALVIDDRYLCGAELRRHIEDFLGRPDKIEAMRNNFRHFETMDAGEALVKEVLF